MSPWPLAGTLVDYCQPGRLCDAISPGFLESFTTLLGQFTEAISSKSYRFVVLIMQ
jgi:hypothetical protein